MNRWLIPTVLVALAAPAALLSQTTSPTSFKRDPAALKAKQVQLVTLMQKQSPEGAKALDQLFAQDIVAMLAPEMTRMGLNPNDMADMTAVYWVTAWEASQGIAGQKTAPALARGARDQLAKVLGGNAAIAKATDAQKQEIADTMLLQALIAELRMQGAKQQGADALKQTSDAIHAEAGQLLKTDLRQVTLTPAGFVPKAGGAAPAPAARAPVAAAPASPGAHAGNWAKVDGVFFKVFYTFGVGGMMIVDYEPVVLFKDGSYYEVEGEALEDIDLAQRRAANPRKWGRWARTATGYALSDSKGQMVDMKLQDGKLFKAFPAETTQNRLAAKYTRVSGGGNSSLGGDVTIAAQNDLTFAPDGRYMRASSAGAISGGGWTGVGTSVSSRKPVAGVGSYRIERYTITLTEPNGQTKRQFFAFGSKKTPAQPDVGMVFFGDRVFTNMDD